MRNPILKCALVVLLTALAALVRADAVADFETAADHYRNGRWQEACDVFARLLADPQFARQADAHFYYGEALVQLDRWSDARPQFARVLELDPQGMRTRQSQFRVGEASYMIGNDDQAERELAAFQHQYPDDPLNAYGLAYLGGLALQADRAAQAEKYFETSLTHYPDGPMAAESQFGLAQSLHQQNRLEEARQAYQRVADTAGELAAPALLQVGAIDNIAGEHSAALAAFQQFAQRFPQSPLHDKAELGRGYALLKLGHAQEAEQAFTPLASKPGMATEGSYYLALTQAAEGQWQQAAQTLGRLQLDPDHALAPAVSYYLADALSHTGDIEGARAQFDRVLQTYGNTTWADDSLLGKLRLAVESKDTQSSLQLADELLDRYPDSPLAAQAKLVKGQALAMIDKPEEAVSALRSLIETDASTLPGGEDLKARAQGMLAVAQAKLGQFDEAQKSLGELANRPEAAALVNEAKLHVSQLANQAGQQPVARQMLAGVVESGSKLAEQARTSLGWNHFESGDWAQAADEFQRVLESATDPAVASEAALLRGRALEHLQKADDALAMYNEAVSKYADTARAPEALSAKAHLLEQLGRSDEAQAAYAALVESYPQFKGLDEALYRQAWLLKNSDAAAANQLFAKIREEFAGSPYAADATLRQAELALEHRNFDSATSLLREISRPDAPSEIRPAALYLEGRMKMVRGEWQAAQKPLEQLVREHPDSDLALPAEYLVAEATFRQGDYEAAVERLRALLEKAGERDDAWLPTAELRQAQSLAQLRRWDEAADAAQNLIAHYPQFRERYEAEYLIGRAFAARANFDEARKWYGQAATGAAQAGSETAAMAQWMVGESYFHQEKYREALAEYLRVSETSPRWHSAALLQAGKAAETLGDTAEAATRYQQLLEKYPDSQLREEAARRLEAVKPRAAEQPTARK